MEKWKLIITVYFINLKCYEKNLSSLFDLAEHILIT